MDKRAQIGEGVREQYEDLPHRFRAAPEIRGEVAICPTCHAIYRPKGWRFDEPEYQRLVANPSVERLECGACQAIARGDSYGTLHLDLTGLARHAEQIRQTAVNEATRAQAVNPFHRIVRLDQTPEAISIETLTPFLAHRIARALVKAIHGTVADSDYAPGSPYARVRWGRMAGPDSPKAKG